MVNANDHVASEKPGRFSTCIELRAIYLRLRCGDGCTDVLDVICSLLRAITPRDCATELLLLSRRTGHASRRVDHLEHQRRTGDGRGAAGALEARFFGPLGQEIPERILDRGRGVRVPPFSPPETPQRCVLYARIFSLVCICGRCTRR